MPKVLGLDDIKLDGLKILYRADLNLPIHPSTKEFLDDKRIRAIIPTLEKLETASVAILAHTNPDPEDLISQILRSMQIDFPNISADLLISYPICAVHQQ